MISKFLLLLIKGYQRLISPFIPARCRYYPTCSEYAKTAIVWHGMGHGMTLTIKRISQCHPLGGSGLDFVPLPLYNDIFTPCLTVSHETLLADRGVYQDRTSYVARMNHKLSHLILQ